MHGCGAVNGCDAVPGLDGVPGKGALLGCGGASSCKGVPGDAIAGDSTAEKVVAPSCVRQRNCKSSNGCGLDDCDSASSRCRVIGFRVRRGATTAGDTLTGSIHTYRRDAAGGPLLSA